MIVVLKHVPGACVIKLLLEWYVFMLWSLFVVVQLQQYPAESQVTSALSLSLDLLTDDTTTPHHVLKVQLNAKHPS